MCMYVDKNAQSMYVCKSVCIDIHIKQADMHEYVGMYVYMYVSQGCGFFR